jgi:hypothetical protein
MSTQKVYSLTTSVLTHPVEKIKCSRMSPCLYGHKNMGAQKKCYGLHCFKRYKRIIKVKKLYRWASWGKLQNKSKPRNSWCVTKYKFNNTQSP